jgi:hypothetical protein
MLYSVVRRSAKRLAQIERDIARIKARLRALGVVRPGSLTRQYKDPQARTGAYYQVSYTHRMQSKTTYVRPPFVPEVRHQIRDYHMLKQLIERWVALGIEYSQLSMRLRSR